MTDTPLYELRYPGYDVLAKSSDWDERTRDVLRDRVERVPTIRFFHAREAATLRALADVMLPQDDRPPELRIPILEWIDEALAKGVPEPQRHEDMPPRTEAWRLLATALDEEAQARGAASFDALPRDAREQFIRDWSAGNTRASAWSRLPPSRAWRMALEGFVGEYYAHPYAWSEIGFGGPKFPRIYARTMRDNPDEPQEAEGE